MEQEKLEKVEMSKNSQCVGNHQSDVCTALEKLYRNQEKIYTLLKEVLENGTR